MKTSKMKQFIPTETKSPRGIRQEPSVKSSSRGVAMLPTVMILGVLALTVAVSITALSFTELFTSQGSAYSSRAHFYAEAGARDALVRIARNKTYTCPTNDCYSVDFSANGCSLGSGCAKVSVSTGTGDTGNPKVVISKGTMKSSTRTLEVSVIFDGGAATHGEITATSWRELTN